MTHEIFIEKELISLALSLMNDGAQALLLTENNNQSQQIPFTTDWFASQTNRMHARHFCVTWQLLNDTGHTSETKSILEAYRQYTEDCLCELAVPPALTLLQAWALVQACEACSQHTGECAPANCFGSHSEASELESWVYAFCVGTVHDIPSENLKYQCNRRFTC
ncbi:FlhC family transcriptional regulator [Kosakonia sp. BK9b]|uniref:FlhC family transcriptional regulator n=1 Tax=Kosakonia sp. TaxID=1916651 RepID=UPI0028A14372|nr:FlhC family transcriptional regulator [Kosakonia sp.]